jgi:hypothetical protein
MSCVMSEDSHETIKRDIKPDAPFLNLKKQFRSAITFIIRQLLLVGCIPLKNYKKNSENRLILSDQTRNNVIIF